jgi:dTDP-4-dehydrorhamnose reductase
MKILITGANGQLGQDIHKLCGQKSIDYLVAGSGDLDITNLSLVRRYLVRAKPDVIVNCAAYNDVDNAEKEWKNAFRVNGLGVRNLSLVANSIDAILVHYSSDYVFDGQSTKLYTIADSPNPINCYGRSKLLGEQMIRDIAHNYVLIRTSWVFGKGNDNFPKKVISWSKENEELKVVTDQISSPSYTKDLAQATLDLVANGAYGIYHITNSGQCSRYEWAAFILDEIGWEGTIKGVLSDEFLTPAKRPGFSVLDSFGTQEVLGYSMPDWKDATRRFLREIEVAV